MSAEQKLNISEELIKLDKQIFDIELKVGNFDEYCQQYLQRSDDEDPNNKFYFTTILQAM